MLLCLTIIGTTVIHLPSPLASTLPVASGSCTSAGITDQPPVQRNLISHQCAEALLIIGGVEQNPGPAQLSTEQQLQDLDGILARLSSNAPSNDVRDTMRLYDPRLDQKALERQINKASKSALVACLAYLGRSDMNEFTKDACVTAMICRIQNLLPDQCNLCKKQYCINITDIRAGTKTPSDEYDSYRKYRVANTKMYSRIHFFSEAKLGNGLSVLVYACTMYSAQ